MRRVLRVLAALGSGLAVALATHSAAATPTEVPDDVLGPGLVTVEVPIQQSRFDLDGLRVHRGTTVELVVRNGDFIAHELIIGDDAVHRRHESGTHPEHPPVPGEVSVGPYETGVTVYTFDEPGPVRFACHLPGHVAYGMEGVIEVI